MQRKYIQLLLPLPKNIWYNVFKYIAYRTDRQRKAMSVTMHFANGIGGCSMSFERGGRGDKDGNRYEDRFFAKLVLDLLLEKLVSIEVERLGPEG